MVKVIPCYDGASCRYLEFLLALIKRLDDERFPRRTEGFPGGPRQRPSRRVMTKRLVAGVLVVALSLPAWAIAHAHRLWPPGGAVGSPAQNATVRIPVEVVPRPKGRAGAHRGARTRQRRATSVALSSPRRHLNLPDCTSGDALPCAPRRLLSRSTAAPSKAQCHRWKACSPAPGPISSRLTATSRATPSFSQIVRPRA